MGGQHTRVLSLSRVLGALSAMLKCSRREKVGEKGRKVGLLGLVLWVLYGFLGERFERVRKIKNSAVEKNFHVSNI